MPQAADARRVWPVLCEWAKLHPLQQGEASALLGRLQRRASGGEPGRIHFDGVSTLQQQKRRRREGLPARVAAPPPATVAGPSGGVSAAGAEMVSRRRPARRHVRDVSETCP